MPGGILDRWSLIALESVARVEGELAVNPQHLHAAVDGVHVQQPHGPWRAFHSPEKVFVGIHNSNHLSGFIELGAEGVKP
jgi:hypothetical protein